MNFIFPYIDILILAFLAVFLGFRLKNLLGDKSGYEDNTKIENEKINTVENKVIPINNNIYDGKGIEIIKKADSTFSEKQFINGAESAFKIIVKAFSESDLDTLKKLLGYDLLKNFTKEITERTARNETTEADIASIDKIEIIDANVSSNIANITVIFISQQSKQTKNVDGKVIEGDIGFHETIKDKWTFEKELSDLNPNWKLIETDSAD